MLPFEVWLEEVVAQGRGRDLGLGEAIVAYQLGVVAEMLGDQANATEEVARHLAGIAEALERRPRR